MNKYSIQKILALLICCLATYAIIAQESAIFGAPKFAQDVAPVETAIPAGVRSYTSIES